MLVVVRGVVVLVEVGEVVLVGEEVALVVLLVAACIRLVIVV